MERGKLIHAWATPPPPLSCRNCKFLFRHKPNYIECKQTAKPVFSHRNRVHSKFQNEFVYSKYGPPFIKTKFKC